MTDAIDLQTLAQEARSHFKRGKRDSGESYWSYDHSTTPEWVQEMTREAHGSMFPDDWKYQFVVEALDGLAEDDNPTIEADIYNYELCEWLSSHGNRPGYVDETIEDMGWTHIPNGGIMGLISWGQYTEKNEVLDSVKASLEARLEELEEEEETEEGELRPYPHPGKFEGGLVIDEAVYGIGCWDEEAGDVQENGRWYGLLRDGIEEAQDDAPELTEFEREYLRGVAGAIVSENDQGFVSVDYFDTAEALEATWDRIEADLSPEDETDDDDIPSDYPVQPLGPDDVCEHKATCGHCGRSWDDGKETSMTPAPSGRCPFEAWHRSDD